MEIWIPLLGRALGGAVISGLVAFAKTLLDHRHERRIWLRDKKFEIYTALVQFLLDEERDLKTNSKGRFDVSGELTSRMEGTHAALLLASTPLKVALMNWSSATTTYAVVANSGDTEKSDLWRAELALLEAQVDVRTAIQGELGVIPDRRKSGRWSLGKASWPK
ncbi:hypothetical protein [Arthrobacter woluwensis]|uniref:hypothetical protein n=1 Tax=Arthrobacter woluwensis TaxID=156980 RepID=UPI0011B25DF2|nr:hypothetical protein [Arthrobacter woluwensis]